MTYTAGLKHHSISRSRTVSAPTLQSAKRRATKAFQGEFRDYKIVIVDESTGEIVAQRYVGSRRWTS